MKPMKTSSINNYIERSGCEGSREMRWYLEGDVGSREGCFSFLFIEGNKGLAFERYMAVHVGFLCSTRRDLKGC